MGLALKGVRGTHDWKGMELTSDRQWWLLEQEFWGWCLPARKPHSKWEALAVGFVTEFYLPWHSSHSPHPETWSLCHLCSSLVAYLLFLSVDSFPGGLDLGDSLGDWVWGGSPLFQVSLWLFLTMHFAGWESRWWLEGGRAVWGQRRGRGGLGSSEGVHGQLVPESLLLPAIGKPVVNSDLCHQVWAQALGLRWGDTSLNTLCPVGKNTGWALLSWAQSETKSKCTAQSGCGLARSVEESCKTWDIPCALWTRNDQLWFNSSLAGVSGATQCCTFGLPPSGTSKHQEYRGTLLCPLSSKTHTHPYLLHSSTSASLSSLLGFFCLS